MLAEVVPRHTQRLYRLVDMAALDEDLAKRVVGVEEAIYTDPDDTMVNWDSVDLRAIFDQNTLTGVEFFEETVTAPFRVGAGQVARWFAVDSNNGRPTYAWRLLNASGGLTQDELTQLKQVFERQLVGQMVSWQSTVAYVVANKV